MSTLSDEDFPPLVSKGARKQSRRIESPRISVSRTSATINDLPNELLVGILEHLPGADLEDFQLAALVNLSRVSRRFHGLVAERLYASYDSHFHEPYLFLRTVISNGDLAGLVRHVGIAAGAYAHRDRDRYSPNAQDKKIVKEGLKALRISDWKTWATDCNTKDVELDTLYTAILMTTSKVSSLNIYDSSGMNSDKVYKTPKWLEPFRIAHLATSPGDAHRFKYLQSLRIEISAATQAPLWPISLAPSFKLLTLRKLSFRGLANYPSEDGRAAQLLQNQIPPRCNNIDELNLEQTFLQNDILAVIVASMRSLKSFKYDLTCKHLPDFAEYEFGSLRLVEALETQRTSLEILAYTSDDEGLALLPSTFNLHSDLGNFPALKHLSSLLLHRFDENGYVVTTQLRELPSSLTSLHVIVDEPYPEWWETEVALKRLVSDHANYTPHLRKVRVEARLHTWYEHDWSNIVALYSDVGIVFVVEEEPHDDDGDWIQYGTGRHNFRAVPNDDIASESSGEISLYSD